MWLNIYQNILEEVEDSAKAGMYFPSKILLYIELKNKMLNRLSLWYTINSQYLFKRASFYSQVKKHSQFISITNARISLVYETVFLSIYFQNFCIKNSAQFRKSSRYAEYLALNQCRRCDCTNGTRYNFD